MEQKAALRAVSDIEVDVSVRLAETSLSLAEILELRPGCTLSFPQGVGAPLSLEIDGAVVGLGVAVERRGRLGLRIEELVPSRHDAADLAAPGTDSDADAGTGSGAPPDEE